MGLDKNTSAAEGVPSIGALQYEQLKAAHRIANLVHMLADNHDLPGRIREILQEHVTEWADCCNAVEAAHGHAQEAAKPSEPTRNPLDAASFKNFHRSLCARFGYAHDEQFWWRDQVSLEEHIAGLLAKPSEGSGNRQTMWEALSALEHARAGGRGSNIDEAIAALRAALAQPAEPGGGADWISIKDRLPEPHVAVALLNEDRWMNAGGDFDINWHGAGWLCEFGSKYWSVIGETRGMTLDSVTHWMPLPRTDSAEGITK